MNFSPEDWSNMTLIEDPSPERVRTVMWELLDMGFKNEFSDAGVSSLESYAQAVVMAEENPDTEDTGISYFGTNSQSLIERAEELGKKYNLRPASVDIQKNVVSIDINEADKKRSGKPVITRSQLKEVAQAILRMEMAERKIILPESAKDHALAVVEELLLKRFTKNEK